MSKSFAPATHKWPDESLQSLTMTQRQPNNSYSKPKPEPKLLRGFFGYFRSLTIDGSPTQIETELPIRKQEPLDIYQPDLSEVQLLHRHASEVEPIDGTFVDDAVRTFKDQRVRGYQFAVLVLSPEYQVTLRNIPAYDTTDNTSPTHPFNSTLRDYIVARPIKRKQHAEELLLERFDELLARNASSCRSIVLYTWFVPCEDCTRKIIHVLGQLTYRVTVVYSSKMRNMIEEEERRNMSNLEAAGITVIKRRYTGYLQQAVKIKSCDTALAYTSPHIYNWGDCFSGANNLLFSL